MDLNDNFEMIVRARVRLLVLTDWNSAIAHVVGKLESVLLRSNNGFEDFISIVDRLTTEGSWQFGICKLCLVEDNLYLRYDSVEHQKWNRDCGLTLAELTIFFEKLIDECQDAAARGIDLDHGLWSFLSIGVAPDWKSRVDQALLCVLSRAHSPIPAEIGECWNYLLICINDNLARPESLLPVVARTDYLVGAGRDAFHMDFDDPGLVRISIAGDSVYCPDELFVAELRKLMARYLSALT